MTSRDLAGQPAQTLLWDEGRRLEEVNEGATTVAEFLYDIDDTRVRRVTDDGTATYYIHDGTEYTETATGNYFTYYHQMNGKTVAFTRSDTDVTTWMGTDIVNSTAVTRDENGVTNTQRFTPFGELRNQGNLATDHLFTGQILDESSGLAFYNARYYDPAIGRFITPDSIVPNPQDGQEYNRYTYVRNNPVKYNDPTGNVYDCSGANCGMDLSRFIPSGRAPTIFSFMTAPGPSLWEAGRTAQASTSSANGFRDGLVNPFKGTTTVFSNASQGCYVSNSCGTGSAFTPPRISITSGPVLNFEADYDAGFALGAGTTQEAGAALLGGVYARLLRAGMAGSSFFTVQSTDDAARLASGGAPWPTAPARAELGPGVYAFDNAGDAGRYAARLESRGACVQVCEFSLDTSSLSHVDIDSLADPAGYMAKHSQLWGGTPSHGVDYITRGTQFGTQHYFSPNAFSGATWIGPR